MDDLKKETIEAFTLDLEKLIRLKFLVQAYKAVAETPAFSEPEDFAACAYAKQVSDNVLRLYDAEKTALLDRWTANAETRAELERQIEGATIDD